MKIEIFTANEIIKIEKIHDLDNIIRIDDFENERIGYLLVGYPEPRRNANPDIKGVFAHNDEMALGAVEAIGDKEIAIIGFDATDDALKAVKDGKMKATVAQQPDLMGATAVENAMKLINGEAVEPVIGVQVSLIK